MTCNLCKNRPPDNKNAHIIPFFLIKSIVTPDEVKRSDKDVSFNLTSHGLVDFFIGRLSEDDVHSILGRDMTDEELAKNSNPYTVDNFICTKCEEKFSKIESLFSSTVFPKIKSFANKSSEQYTELEVTDSLLLKLFSYSIIWRIGASKFQGNNLKESNINKLSKILNYCLTNNEKDLVPNVLKYKSLLNRHKISISFFEDPAITDTRLVFFENNKSNPYSFFLNGLTIQYVFKKSILLKKGNKFYGLEKSINRKLIFNNENVMCFKVSKTQILEAMGKINTLICKDKLKEFRRGFMRCYFKRKNHMPPTNITNAYIREVIDPSYKFVDKFSLLRMAKIAIKYCG